MPYPAAENCIILHRAELKSSIRAVPHSLSWEKSTCDSIMFLQVDNRACPIARQIVPREIAYKQRQHHTCCRHSSSAAINSQSCRQIGSPSLELHLTFLSFEFDSCWGFNVHKWPFGPGSGLYKNPTGQSRGQGAAAGQRGLQEQIERRRP